ncbi:MAG: alanine racemase [Elusimicrobiota bacterium]|jgi:alanine racemase|nr:alanine racemase [Elusimicrobiota bacterium]
MKKTKSLRTWVEIDRKAFVYNIKNIKKFLDRNVKIMLVVKSNGYGHGAVELSKIAQKLGIKDFAVSCAEEGIELRKARIEGNILILGAAFPYESLEIAYKNDLIASLSNDRDIDALEKLAAKMKKNLKFHLAVDTGMGRLGLCFDKTKPLIDKIVKSKNIKMTGLYTHFAAADTDLAFTKKQIARFNEVAKYARSKGLEFLSHSANSAAIFNNKEAHFDMVRPGICVYGLEPFKGYEKKVLLKPVLSWKTRIVFIKEVCKNYGISYGSHFITKKNSKIAVLPIGYADGYGVLLSNKAKVITGGKFCPILGRVTMNFTMIDVSEIKNIKEGDEVVIIGSQKNKKIKAQELAKIEGTIVYETVCSISPNIARIIV